MASFAPQNIQKLNQYGCRNENIFVVMGQPFRGFYGNFMVLIVGAKQGDEATRISNDNGFVTFLHRGIHRSARTNPPVLAPAAPPPVWRTEARHRLLSRGSHVERHQAPCLLAHGSLQPQPCSRVWPEALYPVLVPLLNTPVFGS